MVYRSSEQFSTFVRNLTKTLVPFTSRHSKYAFLKHHKDDLLLTESKLAM